jgi:hypothetical protein
VDGSRPDPFELTALAGGHRQDRGTGVGPGHGFGGFQAERAGEHRQAPEDALLGFGEQLVAPVHGGIERPLPGRRGPVGADQQPETVIEPVQHRAEAERLDPGGGQLDGERHPVQPLHQPGHDRARLAVQREAGVELTGALDEQRHRLRLGPKTRTIRVFGP